MTVTPATAPELPGWAAVAQIKERLGVSRQTVHQMFAAGEFASLHKVGQQYVVSLEELDALEKKREFPRSGRALS